MNKIYQLGVVVSIATGLAALPSCKEEDKKAAADILTAPTATPPPAAAAADSSSPPDPAAVVGPVAAAPAAAPNPPPAPAPAAAPAPNPAPALYPAPAAPAPAPAPAPVSAGAAPSPTPSPLGPWVNPRPLVRASGFFTDGTIYGVRSFSEGTQVVYGQFSLLGASISGGFVRMMPDSYPDPTFAPGCSGTAKTMVMLSDGSLLLGGSFGGTVSPTGIIKCTSAGTQGQDFKATVNGEVSKIVVAGQEIFILGVFTSVNGQAVERIAKLDMAGNLVSGFATGPGSGTNASILAGAVLGDSLFIGGDFVTYRGAPANHIAKIRVSDGALDATFNPSSGPNGTDYSVRAILANQAHLFVGGDFLNYRGVASDFLMKLNPDGTQVPGFVGASWSDRPDARVNALAFGPGGSSLFAGGQFKKYRGKPVNYVAKMDLSGVIDMAFSPAQWIAGTDKEVRAVFVDGNDLYLGGTFGTYRTHPARYVAKVDAVTGDLNLNFCPPSGNGGTNNTVNAVLGAGEGKAYVSGPFSAVGGYRANNIAVFSPSGELDLAFSPPLGPNGTNGAVRDIEMRNSNLFMVGVFTQYRGLKANYIAKVAPTGFLDLTFNPQDGSPNGFNYAAVTLARYKEFLFVGGAFSQYRGRAAGRILKLTQDGWYDPVFNPNNTIAGFNNGVVNAIKIGGDTLYAGGTFTSYDGDHRVYEVAKLSAFDGNADNTFNAWTDPAGNATIPQGFYGSSDVVYALTLTENDSMLWVGGYLGRYRKVYTSNVAKLETYNGTLDNASDISTNFDPPVHSHILSGPVYAMERNLNNSIYVGGWFSTYTDRVDSYWVSYLGGNYRDTYIKTSNMLQIAPDGSAKLPFNLNLDDTNLNGADNYVFSISSSILDPYYNVSGAFNYWRGDRTGQWAYIRWDTGETSSY